MGSDINIVLEKNSEDKWVFVEEIYYDGRNYDLFAKLAGVTNYGNTKPFVEPRGIPEDASEEMKNKYSKVYHDYTYYDLDELISLCENCITKVWVHCPGGNGKEIEALKTFCRGYKSDKQNSVYFRRTLDEDFINEIKKYKTYKQRRLIIFFDS